MVVAVLLLILGVESGCDQVQLDHQINAAQGGERRLAYRSTDPRPYQNKANPFDADNDGTAAPADALLLIQSLATSGNGVLPLPTSDAKPPPFCDVNGDRLFTSIDVDEIFVGLNSGGQHTPAPVPSVHADPEAAIVYGAGVVSNQVTFFDSDKRATFSPSQVTLSVSNAFATPISQQVLSNLFVGTPHVSTVTGCAGDGCPVLDLFFQINPSAIDVAQPGNNAIVIDPVLPFTYVEDGSAKSKTHSAKFAFTIITATPTPTLSATRTPPTSPTATASNTPTKVPTIAPTATLTPAPTPTRTNTSTASPTVTPSITATRTLTATPTRTNTATPVTTATPTLTPTPRFPVPEDFGAVGNGIHDDTKALQDTINQGGEIRLTSGRTYRITSTLQIPSGVSIVGERSSTVLMGGKTGEFTLQDRNIYLGDKASGFSIANASNIVLRGFSLAKEPVAKQAARGIVLQSVNAVTIEGLAMTGFSNAPGIITLDTGTNITIRNNYIHDCAMIATDVQPQLTGISVDNGRVGGVASRNVFIDGNTITNLTMTAELVSRYSYQTDGININHHDPQNINILNNSIANVGEGIDMFGSSSTIRGNAIQDAYMVGIKVIHGASYNLITENVIRRPGLAGIWLHSSSTAVQHSRGNIISGNSIFEIDPHNNWRPESRVAGVRLSAFYGNPQQNLPPDPYRPIQNTIEWNTTHIDNSQDSVVYEESGLRAINSAENVSNVIRFNERLLDQFNGGSLMSNWQVLEGGFQPSGGKILTGVNGGLMVHSGIEARDLQVSADVSFNPGGAGQQSAGVVARYSAGGGYYVARAVSRPTGLVTVELFAQMSNGDAAPIGSDVAVSGQSGRLTLECLGNSLRVYWNGQLIIDKSSNLIPGAGKIGLKGGGSGSPAFDNIGLG